MYKSFEIKNFKCFEHFKLQNLARVNLIAGKNGVGKSALLEALFQHCDGHNPEILLSFIKPRRRPFDPHPTTASMKSLCRGFFRGFDTEQTVQISGVNDEDDRRTITLQMADHQQLGALDRLALRLETDEPGAGRGPFELIQFPKRPECVPKPPGHSVLAYFGGGLTAIDPQIDSARFSALTKAGADHEDRILRALKILEPRLERLEILFDDGPMLLHGRTGIGVPIPLSEMGDGMRRWTSLMLGLVQCGNGAYLFDEIENGFHYFTLESILRNIGEAARQFNVQVFATTHSFECIEAAHRAFHGEHANEFRLFRLERVKGDIRAFDYEPDVLEAAIQTDLEVR